MPLIETQTSSTENLMKKQITLLAAGGKSAAKIKNNDHYNDIIKLGLPKYYRSV